MNEPIKRVISYTYQDNLNGLCIELKDMPPDKKQMLLEYYREKYRNVKGKTTSVWSTKQAFKDYLISRTWYRSWVK